MTELFTTTAVDEQIPRYLWARAERVGRLPNAGDDLYDVVTGEDGRRMYFFWSDARHRFRLYFLEARQMLILTGIGRHETPMDFHHDAQELCNDLNHNVQAFTDIFNEGGSHVLRICTQQYFKVDHTLYPAVSRADHCTTGTMSWYWENGLALSDIFFEEAPGLIQQYRNGNRNDTKVLPGHLRNNPAPPPDYISELSTPPYVERA